MIASNIINTILIDNASKLSGIPLDKKLPLLSYIISFIVAVVIGIGSAVIPFLLVCYML
jgi:ABC-type antimicrobial peptide transport system permease subunit